MCICTPSFGDRGNFSEDGTLHQPRWEDPCPRLACACSAQGPSRAAPLVRSGKIVVIPRGFTKRLRFVFRSVRRLYRTLTNTVSQDFLRRAEPRGQAPVASTGLGCAVAAAGRDSEEGGDGSVELAGAVSAGS